MRKRKPIHKFPCGLVSIDPGWNTGIALWDGTNDPQTFAITLPGNLLYLDREEKIYWMLDKFQTFISKHEITHAIIEGVGLWSATQYRKAKDEWVVVGDTKSFIAARMGHTFTLGYLIGGYIALLGIKGVHAQVVNVPSWKGNKTKEEIAEEIHNINKRYYKSNHESDAVGIGFASCGLIDRKHNQKRGRKYAKSDRTDVLERFIQKLDEKNKGRNTGRRNKVYVSGQK